MPPSDDLKVIKDRRPTKADEDEYGYVWMEPEPFTDRPWCTVCAAHVGPGVPWCHTDNWVEPQPDWEAVYHAAAQLDPIACCLSELRDRLAAHPAPAAESAVWVGTAADVAPQLVPITTADGLSPVDAAPKSQQGVTVEELAFILSEAPSGDLGMAYWLFKHRRIGPLLRGEGAPAPKRVVLPEEPPAPVSNPKWFFAGDFRYVQGRRDGWKAARAEVERQQGGQADD